MIVHIDIDMTCVDIIMANIENKLRKKKTVVLWVGKPLVSRNEPNRQEQSMSSKLDNQN